MRRIDKNGAISFMIGLHQDTFRSWKAAECDPNVCDFSGHPLQSAVYPTFNPANMNSKLVSLEPLL